MLLRRTVVNGAKVTAIAAIIARVVALVMAGPFALGTWWFFDSIEGWDRFYSYISILCMILVPLLPRLLYRFVLVRIASILLCVTTIATSIPVMRADLTLMNGADIPAFVLRCVMDAVLTVLILEAVLTRGGRSPRELLKLALDELFDRDVGG
jgi:hypothetical protein